jgi:hypothetical protein
MKRILSALLTLAVFAAMVIMATTSKRTVRAVHAQGGCSVATLTGNYAFSQPGFISNSQKGNPLPIAVVGVSTFDGAGNVSITYTDMSPGKPGGYGTPIQGTGSGTYTVNSDCTGSVSFTSGDAARNNPQLGDYQWRDRGVWHQFDSSGHRYRRLQEAVRPQVTVTS